MTSKVSATVPWKLKDIIKWLVKQNFYSSEAEFVILAINQRLDQDHACKKFVWAEVSSEAEDLISSRVIENMKDE